MLKEIRAYQKKQEAIEKQIAEYREKVCAPGTLRFYDSLPGHSGGGHSDPTGEAAAKLVDLEIKKLVYKYQYWEARHMISKAVALMPDPKTMKFIHLRYVECRTMQDTAAEMGCTYQCLYKIKPKALEQFEAALIKVCS